MGVYLVGIPSLMKKILYAEFAADNGEVRQMKTEDALSLIATGTVENAKIVGGNLVLIPNDIERYNGSRPTVLKRIVGVRRGYRLYVPGKGVGVVDEEEAHNIIKNQGATNAKAVERDGRKTVSALVGTFPEMIYNPDTDHDVETVRMVTHRERMEKTLQALVPDMEDHYSLGYSKYLVTTYKGNELTYIVDSEKNKVKAHIKSKEDGSSCVRYILGIKNFRDSVFIVLINGYSDGYSELVMLRVGENGVTETRHTSPKFKHANTKSSVGRSKLEICVDGDFFIPILGDKGFNIGYYYGNPLLNKYYLVEWGNIKCSTESESYFRELDTTYHSDYGGMSTDIKALVEQGNYRKDDIFKIELRVKVIAVRYQRLENGEREVLWETEVNKETAKKYGLVEDGVVTKDMLNYSHLEIINMGGYKEPEFVVYGRKRKEKYYFIYGVRVGLMERRIFVQKLADTAARGVPTHQIKESIEDGTIVNMKLENGKIATDIGYLKDYFVRPRVVFDKYAKNKDDRYTEVYAPEYSVILLGRASWDNDLYISSSYHDSGITIQALTESQLISKLDTKNTISNFENSKGRLKFSGEIGVITKKDLVGAVVYDYEYRGTVY